MRTTATGLLFLLGIFWSIYFLHRTWRQLLWEEGVAGWIELEAMLGGEIRTRRAGWKIRGSRGHLQVRGGLWPVESRLQLPDGTVHKTPGIATSEWVHALLQP